MLTCTVNYFTFILIVICVILRNSYASELSDTIQSILENPLVHLTSPEDAPSFTEIARKNGFDCEEFDVTTQDGYILKLFHIIGDKNKPVLMIHGIGDSTSSYIIRGNTSIPINLAEAGYDVWAGNTRGNRYSRRHVSLNPDVDDEFWDFTFHDIAMYDLPALIDFVLDKTGQEKLNTIGHSQGTTIHFALGATKPEYNDKINLYIALAPVCFMNNVPIKIIVNLLKLVPNFDNGLTEEFYKHEILNDHGTLNTILKVVCSQKGIGYDVCTKGILFPSFGDDSRGLERDFLPTYIKVYPTGTSIKSLVHFLQVIEREKFSQFDYGPLKNQKLYESPSPPDYDLSKVTMKTALIVGKNDYLATVPDVELLKSKLPNVVKYHVMSPDKWNHLDFVVASYMEEELIPLILDILKNYS